jgi:hypothetical protein
MSDTRPPITAGPIDRAFRFLKSASLSTNGEGEGLGVAEGDEASCADKIEIAKIEPSKVQHWTIRVIMRVYHRVVRLFGKHVAYREGGAPALTTVGRFAIRRTVVTL